MSKWRGYTKNDLIYIIRDIEINAPRGDYWVEKARAGLRQSKMYAKLREAERWGHIADDKLKEYTELLAPYKSQPLSAIPLPIAEKALKLLEEYEAANKKFLECEVDT